MTSHYFAIFCWLELSQQVQPTLKEREPRQGTASSETISEGCLLRRFSSLIRMSPLDCET